MFADRFGTRAALQDLCFLGQCVQLFITEIITVDVCVA